MDRSRDRSEGDIAFADRLQVDGKITGKLTSDTGTLIIGESGRLDTQIDVAVCVVHGELHGNVIADPKACFANRACTRRRAMKFSCTTHTATSIWVSSRLTPLL